MFACFPIHLLISRAYLSSSGNAFHMLLDFQSPDWNGRVELRYEKESLACLNHMEYHPNNIWQHLESWRANSMPQVYLNCLFVCLFNEADFSVAWCLFSHGTACCHTRHYQGCHGSWQRALLSSTMPGMNWVGCGSQEAAALRLCFSSGS